jgi:hypothetical protein
MVETCNVKERFSALSNGVIAILLDSVQKIRYYGVICRMNMELEDSKLIIMLKAFERTELEKLENYINSPFFNTSEQLVTFFKMLKKEYPSFEGVDKRAIFSKTYPTEEFMDKRIRDLQSRMLGLVENFLAQLEFMKQDLLISRLTLQQLAERDLERHFTDKIKEAGKKMDKEKTINSMNLFSRYSFFKQKRSYMQKFKALGKRNENYEDITEEIDLFADYTVYKILKYALISKGQDMSIKQDYDFKMLNYILEYLKDRPLDDNPVIKILTNMIILSNDEDDDAAYYVIRDLLKDNIDFIDKEDLRYIYIELYNFTKIRSLKDKPEFKKENYRILKESIENGLYPLDGKYLAESSYMTIIGSGLQEGDFEWTENFMEKYKNMLQPELRNNAYDFCKATFNYRKGNYGEALKGLSKISIDDFYYQLRVKNHQLKIYYETGDFEMAKNIIDSYRHFLSTAKFLPDFVKTRFVNYVNFTSRLVNIHLGGERKNLKDITEEINHINPSVIENKTWLLEQISKFKI